LIRSLYDERFYMSCELQKVATAVAMGNAVASTPGVAFGTVAPPAEPLLLAKMFLSWVGLLIAMRVLSQCLEDAGNHHDAESVGRAVDKLKDEMDEMKRRLTPSLVSGGPVKKGSTYPAT
jgi:hypothetical protein